MKALLEQMKKDEAAEAAAAAAAAAKATGSIALETKSVSSADAMSEPKQTQGTMGAGAAGAGDAAGAKNEEDQWVQYYDEETGCPYLFNHALGEAKWIDVEASNDLMVTLWERYYDENGYQYFYNQVKNQLLTQENAMLFFSIF